jgi:hypothetical protein
MLPLPQAFATVPHEGIPPSGVHSGGMGPHTPPVHVCPAGHAQAIVCPHPSVTVPQSIVFGSGVHVSAIHLPASGAVLAPASTAWQAPSTQTSPAEHPPQAMATPHASSPTTPHRPVHALGLQDWVCALVGSATQTLPLAQGAPQANDCPEQGSTNRPHEMPGGQLVMGVHASRIVREGASIAGAPLSEGPSDAEASKLSRVPSCEASAGASSGTCAPHAVRNAPSSADTHSVHEGTRSELPFGRDIILHMSDNDIGRHSRNERRRARRRQWPRRTHKGTGDNSS